mmetsp:Transcript_22184/g.33197  ORF Transcript_22184/g.33197 Transcript_22184/m.33197 type:complete len:113 (+) Transcript_22184:73-411(+)
MPEPMFPRRRNGLTTCRHSASMGKHFAKSSYGLAPCRHYASMGKHFVNSSLGCLLSAWACAALACVDGKHCMQIVHFRSIAAVLFSCPDLPPPPPEAAEAFAAFFALDMAVF